TLCNKLVVKRTVETSLQSQHIVYHDYLCTPTPLNNILWYVIAKVPAGYQIGYYSLLDKNDNIQFYFLPRNDSLLTPFVQSRNVKVFRQFCNDWYCVTVQEDKKVSLNDMRFGQIGGWYKT